MKTQFSFRKYGFTLVEITLVISILIFIVIAFSRLSFRPQENITKAERLANKIASVIHEWLINVEIGRMDKNSNPTTQAIISVSTSTWVSWNYTPLLTWSFVPPFFDSDPVYEIRDITWTGWRLPGAISWTTPYLSIIIDRNRVIFSWALNDTAPIVTIRTRYSTMNKKVVFDRRTGRIEVNKE